MISVEYAPKFLRQLKKLEPNLREQALEKIALFKVRSNHAQLKVHKLHGDLAECWGFSINYNCRIIFEYLSGNEVAFLSIDDHDIYR